MVASRNGKTWRGQAFPWFHLSLHGSLLWISGYSFDTLAQFIPGTKDANVSVLPRLSDLGGHYMLECMIFWLEQTLTRLFGHQQAIAKGHYTKNLKYVG